MFKKANINWTAKQITKMMDKGTITFDNAIQRGYVWDVERKSLLIHSMIVGFPIPAFYAAKSEDGNYDMLDGKQRCKAIMDFIAGQFRLTNVPEIEAENEAGEMETMDINGCLFSGLPASVRDEIEGYSLTVYYFDGITEEEINELFFRLNNGKPLSAIELTRVKTKSFDKIRQLSKHELFHTALTEKAMEKYANEDITIKAHIMLNEQEPCLETKFVRSYAESTEFTDGDVEQIAQVFGRILAAYKLIENKRISRRLITKTHMLTIVPIVWESIERGLSDQEFAEWVMSFFNGTRSATNDKTYNFNAGAGSSKKEAVTKRLEAAVKSFENFAISKKIA